MKTCNTGWRNVTPGKCYQCGCDDDWTCDGRGNIICSCQACSDCGIVDAYGFHEQDCPQLTWHDDCSDDDGIVLASD